MLPTFEVFGISIPMFGIMMLCGMLAAFLLFVYTRRYIRFSEDELLSCALWTIILGFAGSKLLFLIVEFDQVIANPRYLLTTLREGFVFYGALIGGLIGMLIYAKRSRQPFFAFFDLFCPSIALAQAFGRIGCFLAGCCYGRACSHDCAIGVVFPAGSAAPAGVPLLPTQLMESAFLFILTFVLVRILKKRRPFGTVAGWYCVLYGVWRFIIEFFRSDDRGFIGALSTSQFIGIFIVLAGAILLILVKRGILHQTAISEPVSKLDSDEVFGDASEDAAPTDEPQPDAEAPREETDAPADEPQPAAPTEETPDADGCNPADAEPEQPKK